MSALLRRTCFWWIWTACAFGIWDVTTRQDGPALAQAGSMVFASVCWCCLERWRS